MNVNRGISIVRYAPTYNFVMANLSSAEESAQLLLSGKMIKYKYNLTKIGENIVADKLQLHLSCDNSKRNHK